MNESFEDFNSPSKINNTSLSPRVSSSPINQSLCTPKKKRNASPDAINILTPPTPISSDIRSAKIKNSLIRAIYQCNLPADIAQRVENLSWIAEQVLLRPLYSVARTLNMLEPLCLPLDFQQLESLRDSFVKSAVSHLESQLYMPQPSLVLPEQTMELLNYFNENASKLREQKTFVQKSDPVNVGSLNCNNKLAFVPITDKINSITVNSNNLMNKVKSLSIVKLDAILKNPVTPKFKNFLDKDFSCLVKNEENQFFFSAYVKKAAQFYLGQLWKFIEIEGISFDVIHRIKSMTCNDFEDIDSIDLWSKPSEKPVKTPKVSAAIDLLGAKSQKIKRYTSRKSKVNKAKRTKERKLNLRNGYREAINDI